MDFDYGDYLIFADESGDHGLASIDPQFPVFALIFCIIRKDDYVDHVVPSMQRIKLRYWGHDQIIFHEHDIRKEKGDFGLLRSDRQLRDAFQRDISELVTAAPMEVIASVIDKNSLKARYTNPYNPYNVALLFCMERALESLLAAGQQDKRIHVLFESRGRQEDKDLELEFRRICGNSGDWGYRRLDFSRMHLEHRFVHKQSNSSGLQLADLLARPLALRYLRPGQANRASEIAEQKVSRKKVFP